MLTHRVIPCLLLAEGGGLVKTEKFGKRKYVGDPINAVRIFNEKEVDELIVLDIDATRNGRGPDFDLVEQLASECFMPLCYGGGIRTVQDARTLFTLGVEKVSLQSAAFADPTLIRQIADHSGSSSVVVSIDVKKPLFGKPKLFSASGAKLPSEDWTVWLKTALEMGAGEVLINSVDKDGALSGMDLDLIRQASGLAEEPVIAIGGAGSLADIKAAAEAGASAVAAGAFFVFYGPHRAVLITYPRPEELAELWQADR